MQRKQLKKHQRAVDRFRDSREVLDWRHKLSVAALVASKAVGGLEDEPVEPVEKDYYGVKALEQARAFNSTRRWKRPGKIPLDPLIANYPSIINAIDGMIKATGCTVRMLKTHSCAPTAWVKS